MDDGRPDRYRPWPMTEAGHLVELVRAQQRARMRHGELAACDLDPQDAARRIITARAEQYAEQVERDRAVAAARARLGIMVRGR